GEPRRTRQSANCHGKKDLRLFVPHVGIAGESGSYFIVRSAAGRREILRSTTTVRNAPGRPAVTPTVFMSLRCPPDLRSSARTCSIGSSIKDAAISTCAATSSVSPRAAAIASWRVGGSRRTRRGPYLVFQTSLIGSFAASSDGSGIPQTVLRRSINNCATHAAGMAALQRPKTWAPDAGEIGTNDRPQR